MTWQASKSAISRLICCIVLMPGIIASAQSCYDCGSDPDLIDACVSDGGLWHPSTCTCSYKTPIIIDISGNGFQLTDTAGGVPFIFNTSIGPEQTAWTAVGADDAFLVLDRNGNGIIDNSTELFGNATPQPPSDHRNGFAALAEYDKPENGGNNDGQIDSRDRIFSALRLWVDKNHDGLSTPDELFPLPDLGVYSISLQYGTAYWQDPFGNVYRYHSRVNADMESSVGAWAYDVYLK